MYLKNIMNYSYLLNSVLMSMNEISNNSYNKKPLTKKQLKARKKSKNARKQRKKNRIKNH